MTYPMSGQLVPRSGGANLDDGIVSPRVRRDRDRALDHRSARRDLAVHNHQAHAEEQAAGIAARGAVAAAAAQYDAQLAGYLAALPIHDKSDVDFRHALQQATRSAVIGDIWSFRP